MTQLCKHWGRRFAVRLAEADGEIELPMGACRLRAEADHLAIDLQCAEPGQLDRMEEVVAVHLNRFAFRDPLRDRLAAGVKGGGDPRPSAGAPVPL